MIRKMQELRRDWTKIWEAYSTSDLTVKTQDDMMNDIVLYIQDETDFYQAWENVFRGEIADYQNEEDGERYRASQTTWIESLANVLTF